MVSSAALSSRSCQREGASLTDCQYSGSLPREHITRLGIQLVLYFSSSTISG
jgi:hypothetical protein